MIGFIAFKSLGGYNYVRPDQVMAVGSAEEARSNIYMAGGVTVPCSETVKKVVARLEAAMAGPAQAEKKAVARPEAAKAAAAQSEKV
jgi:hypothetical protein